MGLLEVSTPPETTASLQTKLDATYAARAMRSYLLPTGAIADTIPRATHDISADDTILTGRLYLYAIGLTVGDVVTSISFRSRTTALVSGTNQWFALYSGALAKLAVTADDTSTAWGANTTKTLTLTAPYTVLTSGLYYIGACVVASTLPTLLSIGQTHVVSPSAAFIDNGPYTNPASAPTTATNSSNSSRLAYAWVS